MKKGCQPAIHIKLEADKEITIGRLGSLFFNKGYYVYVGSAMKNLLKRTARHRIRRKNLFWHIDYFREEAELLHVLPIRSSSDLECTIAYSMKRIADADVPGFGASDCSCISHLFYLDKDPVMSDDFIDVLLDYRMGRLVSMNPLIASF